MRSLTFLSAAVFVASIWCSPIRARDVPVQSRATVVIDLTAYGTFSARTTAFKDNPTDPTGREGVADDVVLIEQTDQVCARLGTHFGIAFTLASARPDTGLVPLRIVTRFPPGGIVNPQGQRFVSTEGTHTMVVGAATVRLYSFDEPFELVAGVWTFEIHHRDGKIAEKSFIVATHCGISRLWSPPTSGKS